MYNQGAMKMDHEYINGYRLIENRHMTKTKMAIKRNPGQTQKPRAVRIVKKKPVRVTHVPSKEIICEQKNYCSPGNDSEVNPRGGGATEAKTNVQSWLRL